MIFVMYFNNVLMDDCIVGINPKLFMNHVILIGCVMMLLYVYLVIVIIIIILLWSVKTFGQRLTIIFRVY